jgi:sugar-specific transcriptional regulator TrmB
MLYFKKLYRLIFPKCEAKREKEELENTIRYMSKVVGELLDEIETLKNKNDILAKNVSFYVETIDKFIEDSSKINN